MRNVRPCKYSRPWYVGIGFGSQWPKAKSFKKRFCNTIFPQIRQQLANKMKEDHQQAIEEKDAVITLMNDDLQDRGNQIQATQYQNVGLQSEIMQKISR